MITTALIVVGFVLCCTAAAVFLLSVARAPEGTEDETGFHYAPPAVVEAARPRVARSLSRRATKGTPPLKAHIPAA